MRLAASFGMFLVSCKQLRQVMSFHVSMRRSTTVKASASSANADFYNFISSRDWDVANDFWKSAVQKSPENWPSFIKGSRYRDTDMQKLGSVGEQGEFASNDPRYKTRRNFAVKLGYNGSKFHGFQQQRKSTRNFNCINEEQMSEPELLTVEGSIRKVIRFVCNCAGRTDKGVHAISQVINFATSNTDLTPSLILKMLQELPEHKNGDMQVYECVRTPRSFHARSSALWRRYLYMIPLKSNGTEDRSEDVIFSGRQLASVSSIRYFDEMLQTLVHRDLNYRVFSKGRSNQGLKMNDHLHPSERAQLDDSHSSVCRILHANAFVVDLMSNTVVSYDDIEANVDNYAICVELVGNRFLRQMVRKLVGTALRETYSLATRSDQYSPDAEILLKIAASSPDVEGLTFTLPPHGLCFAGVGFDYQQLSIYKFMPKEMKTRMMTADDGKVI